MTRTWALSLALLAGFTPVAGVAQHPSYGPLTWEEGSPLQRLALAPVFARADLVEPGSFTTEVWLGYSNIFEQDSSATHVLFLDTERLLTAVTLRWGADERWEVGARVSLETTGGGVLDGFVHWYHEALGFGQANRDRFPQDGYAQQLSDGGPDLLLDIPRRTLGVEDVQLYGKWGAARSRDGRSALSVQGTLRAPVASNTIGDERADAALVALGRWGAGSWYVHGMLGAGLVRAAPELEEVLRDWTAFAGLGVERPLTGSLSGVAQFQFDSPLLRGFHHRELDWPSNNLVVGLAGTWGAGWSWDASFQEDLPADTPAIDFTLSVRVSRTW